MKKNLGESVQNQDPARGPKARRILIADDDQDSVLSQILGFDHYLVKPYDFSEVLRLLAPLTLPGTDEKRA